MTMVKKNDKRMVKMVRTVTVDSTLAPLAGRDWRCQRNLQGNIIKSIFPQRLLSMWAILYDSCYQYFFKNCRSSTKVSYLDSHIFRWNTKHSFQMPQKLFLQNINYTLNDKTDNTFCIWWMPATLCHLISNLKPLPIVK